MEPQRFLLAAWIRDCCAHKLSPRPRCVALFGSFCGGQLGPESDIDLLLIGDQMPSRSYQRALYLEPVRKAFSHEQANAFPNLPAIISPLFLTEKSWIDAVGLRLSASQQAWIVQDDGFLSESLEEACKWIRTGEWTREDVTTGGWFWVPKQSKGGAVA